jgi:hypothetical protein
VIDVRIVRVTPPGRWGLASCIGWSIAAVMAFGPSTVMAAPAPAPAKTAPAKTAPAKAAPAKTAPKTTPAPTPAATPKTTGTASPKGMVKPGKKAATPDPLSEGTGASKSDVRQSDLYGDRLDGLQVEVDQLKDKIFRSKARLSLLKETVLRGVLAGSRVILAHRNLMGSTFKLVRVVFTMDGAQIYARTDETGSLDSEDELVIYDGNLPPGPHNVTVELVYKGHGYGVFEYLTGYEFDTHESFSFTAPENGAIKVVSVGFEHGNLTTEMKDRPAVQWQEQELDASGRPLAKQKGKTGNGNGAKKK